MWQVDGAACSLEPPTRDGSDGFDGSLDSRPCVVRCLECTWVRDAVCLCISGFVDGDAGKVLVIGFFSFCAMFQRV
jgi:hypothetical protein